MVHQERITFATAGHRHMADVTDQVAAIIERSGVKTGMVHVFCVGSTAAVGAIEFEPGLQRDLPETLDRLIPPSREYGHEQAWHDGNGYSHLQATLLGPSLSVPVAHGKRLDRKGTAGRKTSALIAILQGPRFSPPNHFSSDETAT